MTPQERIDICVSAFAKLGISREQIERKLGYKLEYAKETAWRDLRLFCELLQQGKYNAVREMNFPLRLCCYNLANEDKRECDCMVYRELTS
jgi:hypothetical protein